MKNDQRVDSELLSTLELYPPTELNLDNLTATREKMAKQTLEMNARLPVIEGITQEDRRVPGLAENPAFGVRIYKPARQTGPLPCLFWMHGGGYVVGSVDKDDYRNRLRVKEVGCAVVSVDYRQAPEAPYPAAIEDGYAALKWLVDHAVELGIDRTRIAVGGVSAGGGLAAGLSLLVRDLAEIEVAFQLLIYPMLDDSNVQPASETLPDTYIWSRAKNRFGWRCYLGKEPGGGDVPIYAAPSRAEDLSGLPPVLIVVGDLDLLVDEDIEYAQRLIRAGVPTELHVYPGSYHGFASFAPAVMVSRICKDTCNQALVKAFHPLKSGKRSEPEHASA